MKFVVDSMLGKLARWLRAMGYDAHYQNSYKAREIGELLTESRYLLTRDTKKADLHNKTILIFSNNVGKQLQELRKTLSLSPHNTNLFTRCLICNTPLENARLDIARETVPEYVFYTNTSDLRFCPSCGRHYWPGSHRAKMAKQLKEWGLIQ